MSYTVSSLAYVYQMLVTTESLLGAFAKLRKETISCVMSARQSIRMEQLDSHWTDFNEILFLIFFFENILRKLKFH